MSNHIYYRGRVFKFKTTTELENIKNTLNISWDNLLFKAVEDGNLKLVRIVVKKIIKSNRPLQSFNYDLSLLNIAIVYNHLHVLKYLLTIVTDSYISYAIAIDKNSISMLDIFIRKGINHLVPNINKQSIAGKFLTGVYPDIIKDEPTQDTKLKKYIYC